MLETVSLLSKFEIQQASAVPPEACEVHSFGEMHFVFPRLVNGCSFHTSYTEAQAGENWNELPEHPFENSRCTRSHLSGFLSLGYAPILLLRLFNIHNCLTWWEVYLLFRDFSLSTAECSNCCLLNKQTIDGIYSLPLCIVAIQTLFKLHHF